MSRVLARDFGLPISPGTLWDGSTFADFDISTTTHLISGGLFSLCFPTGNCGPGTSFQSP